MHCRIVWLLDRSGPARRYFGAKALGPSGSSRRQRAKKVWLAAVARAHAQAFPDGLAAFTAALSQASGKRDGPTGMVMHMGEWVGSGSSHGAPPYATNASFAGQAAWAVEGAASLPVGGTAAERAAWGYPPGAFDKLVSDLRAPSKSRNLNADKRFV